MPERPEWEHDIADFKVLFPSFALRCRVFGHASAYRELFAPTEGLWEYRMCCIRCGHRWTELAARTDDVAPPSSVMDFVRSGDTMQRDGTTGAP